MLPCLKILIGGSTDIIMSISSGEYFEDDVPTLVINDGSNFSDAMCSYLYSLVNGTEVV